MLIERLVLATAAALAVLAQDALAADWVKPSATLEGRYDIDWPGGTLEDFVKEADEAFDDIVIMPTSGTEGLTVPPVLIEGLDKRDVLEIPRYVFSQTVYPELVSTGHNTIFDGEEGADSDKAAAPDVYAYTITEKALERYNAGPHRFEVDFKGGTLDEYVAMLNLVAGEQKIVIMPGAMKLPVPGVSLSNVTLYNAVKLLEEVSAVDLRSVDEVVVVNSRPEISVSETRGPAPQVAPAASRTWSIEQSVSQYLVAEDILSAIDAAIDLTGGSTRVRFHAETGLLMAYGPEPELDLVGGVVGDARETNAVRVNGAPKYDTVASLEGRRAEMEIDRSLIAERIQIGMARLKEMEQADREDIGHRDRLDNERLAMKELEAELQKADIQIGLQEQAISRAKNYQQAVERSKRAQ